jgi:hypothetical protein
MHFHTPDTTTTLTPESPPACPGSASFLVVSGLPAQGDFLFSDQQIADWFDSQDEVTARFWIDRAVEMFGLPDSATPRQCWHAFLFFANTGVLAPPPLPELTTHAAVCHGQVFSDKQIRKKAGQWVFGKVVVPSCSNSLGET